MNKKSIHIPEHPYKTEITSFGRDEMAWLTVNTIWTAVIDYMLHNFPDVSEWVRKSLLSVGWPVVEKIGFFIPHLVQWLIKQHKNKEKNIKKLLQETFSWWSETLIKDIFLHDPLYIWMMYLGQEITPQTPTVLLSFVSFISALLVVWMIKVWFDEGKFRYFCQTLQKRGFLQETYYEARIHINSSKEAEKIFEDILKEFSIEERNTREYNDTYYAPKDFKYLGGRTARIRERIRKNIDEVLYTWQLLFTKPQEYKTKDYEQYRYFPIKKNKFAFKADSIQEVRNVLQIFQKQQEWKQVQFQRRYGNDPYWLLVTMDTLQQWANKKYVIELKVHQDLDLLKEAIKKVLTDTSWEQHTHGKDDI